MGTNYYVASQPSCPTCHRPYEGRHIGKSSAGWCFSLRVYPEDSIHTLEDWKPILEGGTITDEYGGAVTAAEMLSVITERAWPKRDRKAAPVGYASMADFNMGNNAVKGPNGLLRHRIGHYCIGHGTGTWDYIIGEFS